jgi:hypothetical protein
MENEKFQVVLNEGQTELVIREGKAQNILDIKPPVKINLVGTIGSAVEFLQRRFSLTEKQFDPERCHVTIDRENVSITLVTNEHDEYTNGSVSGKLEQHPKFIAFGINSGKRWAPNEFGQFCKMNRAFFTDKANNMKLVTLLKNFEASIDSKVEQQKIENGSTKDNKSSVVNSNLPANFSLFIPLFKGVPAEEIEVEFDSTVSGGEITFQLCSPGANQSFEDVRDSVIDVEISKIRGIAPNIVIIEK